MTKMRLKYVVADTDRRGNVRFYFRRKKQKKIRLPGQLGSPEFMKAYLAALDGQLCPSNTTSIGKAASKQSLGWLIEAYLNSSKFFKLSESTRVVRRRILDKLKNEHGHKPFKALERRHIKAMKERMKDRPGAADSHLKALRQVLDHAVDVLDDIPHNHARDVPYYGQKSEIHTWSDAEINQFLRVHKPGSRARLAIIIMLYTGARIGDAVKLGPVNIDKDWLHYTQEKNAGRKPISVSFPMPPEFNEAIQNTITGKTTFLVTEFGKPFTKDGFGNRMRKWCDEAGLHHCSSHGLRKACAVRLAEAGCTDHEIMAITGHQTLKEVQRYTKAANRKRMAASAARKLQRNKD